MTIYRYWAAATDGLHQAYGCPVEVFIAGRRLRLIYQFQGGGQARAVVHYESGRIVCPLTDDHVGAPQIAAQKAVDEKLGNLPAGKVWAAFDNATIVNPGAPERVGTFGGQHHVRMQSAQS